MTAVVKSQRWCESRLPRVRRSSSSRRNGRANDEYVSRRVRDFQASDLDLGRLLCSLIFVYLTGHLWDTENQNGAAERGIELLQKKRKRSLSRSTSPIPLRCDAMGSCSARASRTRLHPLRNRDESSSSPVASCDEDCVAGSHRQLGAGGGDEGGGQWLSSWSNRAAMGGACQDARCRRWIPRAQVDAFAAGFLFATLSGADPRHRVRGWQKPAASVVSREGSVCTEPGTANVLTGSESS